MILTFIISIALDTLPVQPIRVLLPRPVKSQTVKPKQDDKDKNHKTSNADRRVLGRVDPTVANR